MSRRGARAAGTALLAALVGATSASGAGAGAGERMQDAGRALLDAVTARGMGVQAAADDAERLNWNYTPVPRRGLPLLAAEDDALRERMWALVDTGLGERGSRQAREIVALEEVLYARSDEDDRRNPGRYFLTLFGVPGSRGRWGWRFEGHHLSLNFSLRDGSVVGTTPAFFGGSPARVDEGPHAGLRPFAAEEDDARAFVQSLSPEQRRRAVLAQTAPRDILTGNDVPAARPALLGVAYTDLDDERRRALLALLSLYASRLSADLAAEEMAAIEAAGIETLRFAWAGSLEPGQPHYYRIQGPGFIIEYDNAESDAGHVHTVWRNFERDFGNDPLRAHLATAHGPGRTGR